MPAHRCSVCSINFPTTVQRCHICGTSVDYFENAVPSAEWEREVQLRSLDPTANKDTAVIGWRREELIRAGYERADAEILAERLDVDLHRAIELVRQGCAEPLALQILL